MINSESIARGLFAIETLQRIQTEFCPELLPELIEIERGSLDENFRDVAVHMLSCDREDPRVEHFVNRIHHEARIFLAELRAIVREGITAKQESDRKERMAMLSKTHAAGTTAEIAAMLNISKAQVRKFKADGTLDGMIAAYHLTKEAA